MFKAINEYYIELYSKIHALPPEENPYTSQGDLSLEEICPEALRLSVVTVPVPSNVKFAFPAKPPPDLYCTCESLPPGEVNVKVFCI